MSTTKRKVLSALLERPTEPHYGYALMRATGVKSGSLYPILEQLQTAGWLTAEWESIDEHVLGRPPRRLYRLTGEGKRAAAGALGSAAMRGSDTHKAKGLTPRTVG